MREYTIYWMEEEFAHHYFGREGMFYNLFAESNVARGELKTILSKQVDYITKPIPSIHFNQFIESELKQNKSYHFTINGHCVEGQDSGSFACLAVSERSMTLVAKGKYEAEMVFFELLKKWDSRFLAVNVKQASFGWISPVKQRKFV
ncbi:sporulation inhibitor of replication protein SirA [Bacillus pinisoli]|uniref:sporulation inhibitor of replication protein SirA n=1 Tax=Bacillus pinisoli TaxID=2901866 RepID=UPI001FF1F65A|nr:sporulation inhibitor of replication protein SirA [Bacillus pinisoli]